MRLTKLEKQVHELVIEGYKYDAIAAVLQIPVSGLDEVFASLQGKCEVDKRKRIMRADNIRRNECLVPTLLGLTCKNLDRPNPRYWLFEGNQEDAVYNQGLLHELGITATAKQNGTTGSWVLIVPGWVTGTLWPSSVPNFNKQQEEKIKIEGENDYVSSIGNTINANNPSSTPREIYETPVFPTMENGRPVLQSIA